MSIDHLVKERLGWILHKMKLSEYELPSGRPCPSCSSFVPPEALAEQMSSDHVLEEEEEPAVPLTGTSLPDLPGFAAFHATAFLLLTASELIHQQAFVLRRNQVNWFENVTAPLGAMRVRHDVTNCVQNPGFG